MTDELPFEIFIRETERLFETAKTKDEFEYVCALINFNGMGDPRAFSHIHESRDLFFQMVELIEKSDNKHEQIRLLLLLYCHIFEMDEFYNIIGNMLRISLGERYGVMLYNSPTLTTELKPANKLDKLKSLAKKAGFELLIDTIKNLYSSPLRNSFFHSSYSLSGDDYYIVSGKELKINGMSKRVVSLRDYILPLTQSTVNIAGHFFNLLRSSRLDYKENKIVIGRLEPKGVKIEIMGHPERGLSGFKTIIE
ncbi:hypothetical protein ACFQ0I_15715 [Mariniflexile aquimaris]|uniref:Uncharacterized protein n=1 Tax=Mariniflexile aquimaris TaxID=881009 RepID=A0ABW3BVV3_9FLAO